MYGWRAHLKVDSVVAEVVGDPGHLVGLHHDVHLLRPRPDLTPKVDTWSRIGRGCPYAESQPDGLFV